MIPPVNQPPVPEPEVPKTEEEREALARLSHKLQWDMMQAIPDGTNIVVVFAAFLRGAMNAIDDCPNSDAQIAMVKMAQNKVEEVRGQLIAKALAGPLTEILGAMLLKGRK